MPDRTYWEGWIPTYYSRNDSTGELYFPNECWDVYQA